MMTRKLGVAAGFLIGMAAAFSAGVWAQAQNHVVWHWPDSLEAMHADPGEHKVLFENDHVRLLEVIVQPGQKGPVHAHKYPSVFAFDAPQPGHIDFDVDSKKETSRGRIYDDHDWSEPMCRTLGIQAPHQVTDTDTFPEHFYRLEFKRMDGKSLESMTHYDFGK